MVSNKRLLDGKGSAAFTLMSPPVLAAGDEPSVLWWAQERGHESQLRHWTPRGEVRVVDKGPIFEPAVAAGPNGAVLGLWCRAGDDAMFRVWVSDLAEAGNERPVAISAGRASAPAAAWASDGTALAVWARVEGHDRRIEGALGPSWGAAFSIDSGGWASRPAVSARDGCGENFCVVWDTLRDSGGGVSAALIDIKGTVVWTGNVFEPEGPGVRYIYPACADAGGHIMVCAVRIQDIIGDHGIIDQRHTIAAAQIDPRKESVDILPSPANLDHAMLSDPAGPTELGYLGYRLRPGLLPSGRVWWERKQHHDSPAVSTEGVICFRDWNSEKRSWGPESMLYYGGFSHSVAISVEGTSWVAFRQVVPGVSHQIVLDRVDAGGETKTDEEWFTSPHWRGLEFPRNDRPRKVCRVSGEHSLQLLWGDPHVHSSLSSDAEGEPDELCHIARDLVGLDFLALTENDDMDTVWLAAAERCRGDEVADAWTEDGRFVVLSGFEYTRPWLEGTQHNHRTVLLPARGMPLFRWSDPVTDEEKGVVSQDHRNVDGLAWKAEQLGALLIAHHQIWTIADSDAETGVEAVSGWTTAMHNPEYIHRVWDQGRRLCLVGGSDGHRRNAGLSGGITGVWARELSVEGVLEAMRSRRTIATQGRRPLVLFELCDEQGGSLFIGDYGTLRGDVKAKISVSVEPGHDDHLELVELCRGERTLANWSGSDFAAGGTTLSVEFPFRGYDYGPSRRGWVSKPQRKAMQLNEPFYVYLRIRQSGRDCEQAYNAAVARGPWAWTTPIWWEWEF